MQKKLLAFRNNSCTMQLSQGLMQMKQGRLRKDLSRTSGLSTVLRHLAIADRTGSGQRNHGLRNGPSFSGCKSPCRGTSSKRFLSLIHTSKRVKSGRVDSKGQFACLRYPLECRFIPQVWRNVCSIERPRTAAANTDRAEYFGFSASGPNPARVNRHTTGRERDCNGIQEAF